MNSIPEELKKNLTIEDKLIQALRGLTMDDDAHDDRHSAQRLSEELSRVGLKLVEIEK